ncbi:MAG: response regulator [Deltaproteobacteria bacterium]|nr:MAG: response regulator [Deltaproteobacteria bacterium]
MSPTTEWAAYRRRLLLERVRIGSILAALLVPAGVVLEMVLHPTFAEAVLLLRLAFTGVSLLWFGLSFLPSAERFSPLLSYALAISLIAGIEMLMLAGPGAVSDYYVGHIIVLIGGAMLFTWTVEEAGFLAVAAFGSYLLGAILEGELTARPRAVFIQSYFIANAGILFTLGSHLSTRIHRRAFETRWELERLNDARTRLFTQISHELRTPLTLIVTPLELLLSRDDLDAELRGRLEVMYANCQRLMQLTEQLLELARMQSGVVQIDRRPVDLSEFIPAIVQRFEDTARAKGVHIDLGVDTRRPALLDPQQFETVLHNLLSNAIRFSPQGGQIGVRAYEDGTEREPVLHLEVTDEGPGVPAGREEEIFHLFHRAHGERSDGGAGVGLALVKEIVEAHGGTVDVVPGEGRGAHFRVHLPIVADPNNLPPAPGTAAPTPNRRAAPAQPSVVHSSTPVHSAYETRVTKETQVVGRGARILVVEDHADVRHLLASLLGEDYRLEHAATLEEARRALKCPPDLVLCDISLPDGSGLDLLTEVKATHPDLPVLLLTAHGGAEARVEGLAKGADDYIEKPFSPAELLARVRAHLRLRALARELAHAQKLSMLGTLSAGLAHEVRNPAGAVLGAVTALRAGGASGAAAETLLAVVEDSTRRILRLVDQLLRFSHKEGTPGGRWAPDEGVRAVADLLAHKANGRLKLQLDFPGHVPGDGAALEQVVMNLADNGLRYAGEDGTVWIRTRRSPEGGLCLEVEDTGPGVSPDDRGRIFDPFFTTETPGRGTGLGLHLVRGIVEAHRGAIEVREGARGGALFVVKLPGSSESEER